MKLTKTLRYTLIAMVLLFGGTLIVATFLPNTFEAEEDIVVYGSREEIYTLVATIDSMQQWNSLLPGNEVEVIKRGTPKMAGQMWSWHSNDGGEAIFKVVSTKKNSEVSFQFITTVDDKENTMKGKFIISPTEKGVEIDWTISGELGFPIGRFMGSKIERVLEKEMKNSLLELEYILDKRAAN